MPPSSQTTVAEMQRGADASGLRLIGHHDLDGSGDGMQVLKQGDHVYVAHVGASPMALSIVDCADPSAPRLVRQLEHAPDTHRHKVQIVGDVMIQNSELPHFADRSLRDTIERGVVVFDLADPTAPRRVGFHACGGVGAHRLWYAEGHLAHVGACGVDKQVRAYQILDLSDPADPRLVGEWNLPGAEAEDPAPRWAPLKEDARYQVHGIIPHGDRAYVAAEDAGMAILDISDPSAPSVVSRLNMAPPFGGMTHTCLPLPERSLVVVVEESLGGPPYEPEGTIKHIWLVDVRDERQPVSISAFPVPTPTSGPDFQSRPGAFGPHNVHENRPGSYASDTVVFATYFNAGVRVFDISDAFRPAEVAHFLPPTPEGQEGPLFNDLFVAEDGLIYATDRINGGLYILEWRP